jgi:hypothetical protein
MNLFVVFKHPDGSQSFEFLDTMYKYQPKTFFQPMNWWPLHLMAWSCQAWLVILYLGSVVLMLREPNVSAFPTSLSLMNGRYLWKRFKKPPQTDLSLNSLVQVCYADSTHDSNQPTAFIPGTAAVITTVDKIGYLGKDVIIPTGPDGMGPVSRVLWKELVGRQTGVIPSEWSVEV